MGDNSCRNSLTAPPRPPGPATFQRDALSLGNSMKVLEQVQVITKMGFVLDF